MTTRSPSRRLRGERRRGRPPTEGEAKPKRWSGDILFTLIAVLGGLHVLVMLGAEVNRYVYTQGEIDRLQADVAVLEREIGDLEAIIAHAGDERYREQLARLQGFVYPDELRYVTLPRQ